MSLPREAPEGPALPAVYPHCNTHFCRNVGQPFFLIFKRVCVFMSMYVGVMCAMAYTEVRGQLMGIGSLLLPCGF